VKFVSSLTCGTSVAGNDGGLGVTAMYPLDVICGLAVGPLDGQATPAPGTCWAGIGPTATAPPAHGTVATAPPQPYVVAAGAAGGGPIWLLTTTSDASLSGLKTADVLQGARRT